MFAINEQYSILYAKGEKTLKTIIRIKTEREAEKEYLTYRLSGGEGLDFSFRSPMPLDEIQKANHDLVSESGSQIQMDQLAKMCFPPELIIQLGSTRPERTLHILCDSPVLCGIPWEALLACGQNSLPDCTLILTHRSCARSCIPLTVNDLPLRVVFIVNPSRNKNFERGSTNLTEIMNSLRRQFSSFSQIDLTTGLDRFDHASIQDMQAAIHGSDVLIFYGYAVQNPDSYGFDVANNNELLVTRLAPRSDGQLLQLPNLVFCLGSGTSGLAGQLAQLGVPYLFSNYGQKYYQPEVFEFLNLFLHEMLHRLVTDDSFTIWDVNTAIEKKFLPKDSRDYFARMGYFENPFVERDDRMIQNLEDATRHRNDRALLELLKSPLEHSQFICLAISYLLDPLIYIFLKVEIILRFIQLRVSPDVFGAGEAVRIFNYVATQNTREANLLGEVLMDYLAGSELLDKLIGREDLSADASKFMRKRVRSSPSIKEILEYLFMSVSHSPLNEAWMGNILTNFLSHHPEANSQLQTLTSNPLLQEAIVDFVRKSKQLN